MKKLILSYLFFVVVSSLPLKAETHEPRNGSSSDTNRETNTFADYDTLAIRLETWGNQITSGDRVENNDSERKVFTIQLSKSESEEAANLLRRIKWYRNAIVACENADASSKKLGTVLDECIAPGNLSRSSERAVQKDSRWEMSLGSAELISCQTRLADFYREKLSRSEDASKFMVDREISEKLNSLFRLFTPRGAEVRAPEGLSQDLKNSLLSVSRENRCEVGVTRPQDLSSGEREALPRPPPAVAPIQNPPTSLLQRQPEAPRTSDTLSQQNGYVPSPLATPYNRNVSPSYDRDHRDRDDNDLKLALSLALASQADKGRTSNVSPPPPAPVVPCPPPPPPRPFNAAFSYQKTPPYPVQPPMYPPMFFPPPTVMPLPPIIGGDSGACISCGGGSYLPPVTPIEPPSSPCLTGMCQPLPCLSQQCMNAQPIGSGFPSTCGPLNTGYVGLGVGNLGCPVTGGMPPMQNPLGTPVGYPPYLPNTPFPPTGYPPVTNYPPVGIPYVPPSPAPGTGMPPIPYNPNLKPGYQTQYQSVPVNPTTYRIPRGTVRRK